MPRHGLGIVCLMLAIVAFVGWGTPSTAGPAPNGATPIAATPASTPLAATTAVISRDIYFDPDGLTIPANADVTLDLPNEGKALHSFTIDALGIDVYVAPGAEQHVVVNAPPGTYRFYCAVYGHATAGMVGELTVK